MTTEESSKTFCEFFAGIGLVGEGLSPSGWRCVYANDVDPHKFGLYAARNPSHDHFHLADVHCTDEVVASIPGRPFLATASFPCVDLSLAGNYGGIQGKQSSAFFAFAAALERLADRRPPMVLIENVVGFLTSRGGDDFRLAAGRLADLGYWLDAFVLDARHFVPQSRPRVFVVGVTEAFKPASTDWPEPTPLRPAKLERLVAEVPLATGWLLLDLPQPPVGEHRLADVIDVDEGQEWWKPSEVDRHLAMMSDAHRERVDECLRSDCRWVGAIFRRIRGGSQKAEVRFDGLAGCLRTPKGGSARQIAIVVDRGRVRMKWMTPRECARLQGAGDFPLVGSRNRLLGAFGDAVCVPAIRWIDERVLSPIHAASQSAAPVD